MKKMTILSLIFGLCLNLVGFTAGADDELVHEIPPAPKGLTPREQFEWNRDHYFQLVEERRREEKAHKEALKDVTRTDFSTFKPQGFGELEAICLTDYKPTIVTSKGQKIKMLGVAFVNMDRSQGPSAWGHVAERFVYCADQEFRDDLFEYLPLRENLLAEIAEDLKIRYNIDLESYPKEYVASLLHSHYVSFTVRPFDSHYKEIQADENRTIFEIWFKTSEEKMYRMLLNNAMRFKAQVEALREQKPLPRYNLLTNNCTTPVKEDIEIVNPAFLAKFHGFVLTPSFMQKRLLKMDVERFVIYPSQRLFRILQMKEKGESTFLENFAPFSKASKGAHKGGWIFFFPDSQSRWKQVLMKPIGGLLNTGAALVETVYGFLTLPLNLLGRIPGLHKLHSRERGGYRIKSGLTNVLWSLAEVATLRVRYPSATQWSEEEMEFLQGYEQTTALLEFLKAKYQTVPVEIKTTLN